MYSALRPLLFGLDPERAHHLTLNAIAAAGATPVLRSVLRRAFEPRRPARPVSAFGLTFQNVVGLAAGYDKDARGWRGLALLGFGHVEVGTVTPRPQQGNDRPRVFRLPADRALINRMGFPNAGAEAVAARLSGPRPSGLVLGVNIGKNKDTPLERAAEDYSVLVARFAPLADYLAINISSPNTEGLRRLQARDAMESLLRACVLSRDTLAVGAARRPLLVKLAPDLSLDELDDAVDVILRLGLDGVILTNTTLSREGLGSLPSLVSERGGLSGAPLAGRSTAFVQHVCRSTGGRLPIIGVGGIDSPDAARAKIDAGAALVQVYTGLVYAGPGLVRAIVESV